MLKRCWVFVVAFIGLVASAELAAEQTLLFNDERLVCDDLGCRVELPKPVEQEHHTDTAQTSTADESDASEKVVFQSLSTNTPSADSPSPEEERRAAADLYAQQQMAKWAKWMFWATAAGVFLIALTLRESVRAANFAAKALTEAQATTEEAKKTTAATLYAAELQSRAYVIIDKIKVQLTTPNGFPRTIVEVKNVGQTPTHSFSVGVLADFHPDIFQDTVANKDDATWQTVRDLGNGDDATVEITAVRRPKALDRYIAAQRANEPFVLYVNVWLRYWTVADKCDTQSFGFQRLFEASTNLAKFFEIERAGTIGDLGLGSARYKRKDQ